MSQAHTEADADEEEEEEEEEEEDVKSLVDTEGRLARNAVLWRVPNEPPAAAVAQTSPSLLSVSASSAASPSPPALSSSAGEGGAPVEEGRGGGSAGGRRKTATAVAAATGGPATTTSARTTGRSRRRRRTSSGSRSGGGGGGAAENGTAGPSARSPSAVSTKASGLTRKGSGKAQTPSSTSTTPTAQAQGQGPLQQQQRQRERLWHLLESNVNHAVDEVYAVCEEENNPELCQRALRLLEAGCHDFTKLIERIHLQREYEERAEELRKTKRGGLGWEVRKTTTLHQPPLVSGNGAGGEDGPPAPMRVSTTDTHSVANSSNAVFVTSPMESSPSPTRRGGQGHDRAADRDHHLERKAPDEDSHDGDICALPERDDHDRGHSREDGRGTAAGDEHGTASGRPETMLVPDDPADLGTGPNTASSTVSRLSMGDDLDTPVSALSLGGGGGGGGGGRVLVVDTAGSPTARPRTRMVSVATSMSDRGDASFDEHDEPAGGMDDGDNGGSGGISALAARSPSNHGSSERTFGGSNTSLGTDDSSNMSDVAVNEALAAREEVWRHAEAWVAAEAEAEEAAWTAMQLRRSTSEGYIRSPSLTASSPSSSIGCSPMAVSPTRKNARSTAAAAAAVAGVFEDSNPTRAQLPANSHRHGRSYSAVLAVSPSTQLQHAEPAGTHPSVSGAPTASRKTGLTVSPAHAPASATATATATASAAASTSASLVRSAQVLGPPPAASGVVPRTGALTPSSSPASDPAAEASALSSSTASSTATTPEDQEEEEDQPGTRQRSRSEDLTDLRRMSRSAEIVAVSASTGADAGASSATGQRRGGEDADSERFVPKRPSTTTLQGGTPLSVDGSPIVVVSPQVIGGSRSSTQRSRVPQSAEGEDAPDQRLQQDGGGDASHFTSASATSPAYGWRFGTPGGGNAARAATTEGTSNSINNNTSAMSSGSSGTNVSTASAVTTPSQHRSLHEKLSSPERRPKLSAAETRKRQEERLHTAEQKRRDIESEKQNRARLAAERAEDARSQLSQRLTKVESLINTKLQSAEKRRGEHVRAIVSKAENENSKVDEVNFINTLNEQANKASLQDRLCAMEERIEAGRRRREEHLVGIRAKQQRRGHQRTQQLTDKRNEDSRVQAERLQRLQEKVALVSARREERLAMLPSRPGSRSAPPTPPTGPHPSPHTSPHVSAAAAGSPSMVRGSPGGVPKHAAARGRPPQPRQAALSGSGDASGGGSATRRKHLSSQGTQTRPASATSSGTMDSVSTVSTTTTSDLPMAGWLPARASLSKGQSSTASPSFAVSASSDSGATNAVSAAATTTEGIGSNTRVMTRRQQQQPSSQQQQRQSHRSVGGPQHSGGRRGVFQQGRDAEKEDNSDVPSDENEDVGDGESDKGADGNDENSVEDGKLEQKSAEKDAKESPLAGAAATASARTPSTPESRPQPDGKRKGRRRKRRGGAGAAATGGGNKNNNNNNNNNQAAGCDDFDWAVELPDRESQGPSEQDLQWTTLQSVRSRVLSRKRVKAARVQLQEATARAASDGTAQSGIGVLPADKCLPILRLLNALRVSTDRWLSPQGAATESVGTGTAAAGDAASGKSGAGAGGGGGKRRRRRGKKPAAGGNESAGPLSAATGDAAGATIASSEAAGVSPGGAGESDVWFALWNLLVQAQRDMVPPASMYAHHESRLSSTALHGAEGGVSSTSGAASVGAGMVGLAENESSVVAQHVVRLLLRAMNFEASGYARKPAEPSLLLQSAAQGNSAERVRSRLASGTTTPQDPGTGGPSTTPLLNALSGADTASTKPAKPSASRESSGSSTTVAAAAVAAPSQSPVLMPSPLNGSRMISGELGGMPPLSLGGPIVSTSKPETRSTASVNAPFALPVGRLSDPSLYAPTALLTPCTAVLATLLRDPTARDVVLQSRDAMAIVDVVFFCAEHLEQLKKQRRTGPGGGGPGGGFPVSVSGTVGGPAAGGGFGGADATTASTSPSKAAGTQYRSPHKGATGAGVGARGGGTTPGGMKKRHSGTPMRLASPPKTSSAAASTLGGGTLAMMMTGNAAANAAGHHPGGATATTSLTALLPSAFASVVASSELLSSVLPAAVAVLNMMIRHRPRDAASSDAVAHAALMDYLCRSGTVQAMIRVLLLLQELSADLVNPHFSAHVLVSRVLSFFEALSSYVASGAPTGEVVRSMSQLKGKQCHTAHAQDILSLLKSSDFSGSIVSCLGAFLLAAKPQRHDAPDPRVSEHALNFAALGLRVLNNFARVDVSLVQQLGGDGLRASYLHMCDVLWHAVMFAMPSSSSSSSLLSAAAASASSSSSASADEAADCLAQLLVNLGYFTLDSQRNQGLVNWGTPPTLLMRLCGLPFEYYSSDEHSVVLLPTLLSVCLNNDINRMIVDQELSSSILADFVRKISEECPPLTAIATDNGPRSEATTTTSTDRNNSNYSDSGSASSRSIAVSRRFPESFWTTALDFFSSTPPSASASSGEAATAATTATAGAAADAEA